jgi:Holliday junction resolvase RusA-like endonuclease
VILLGSVEVVGRPAPQGSKHYLGKGRFKESSKHLDNWRNDTKHAASLVFREPAVAGPIFTKITFLVSRPKNHYVGNNRERGVLKADAPYWHAKMPDRDKLERATNDALKGVAWIDDAQVAATLSSKIYAPHDTPSGASIEVYLLSTPENGEDLLHFLFRHDSQLLT